MSVATETSGPNRRRAQSGSRDVLVQQTENGSETTSWAQREADRKPLPGFESTPERKPLPSTWDS